MANTVIIKRSAVPGKVPTTGDLQLGELAINTYDGKLYTAKDNGTSTVIEIGNGPNGTSGHNRGYRSTGGHRPDWSNRGDWSCRSNWFARSHGANWPPR
jgi:hypothetical protein